MDKNPTTDRGTFTLIDPNDFSGQSNTDNMYNQFVPLEDLSISVELTTNTKVRSILTSNKEGGQDMTNVGSGVRISFIDGKKVGTKNVLTTSYTDLHEVKGNEDDDESLGITNIDIDFNSSYAPMITISFVDVRGGAIFQNGANSKYGVLFKMPYPLFRLKIKGYYGKPVTYCLHLTKVTSKFNSQTGNFEILAHFVGYTYAMLTDMLIGHLKAIPEMKEGADIFAPLKKSEGIIPLNDLISGIQNINALAKKIPATSQNAKDLASLLELKEKLSDVKGDVFSLKVDLGGDTTLLPADTNFVIKAAVPEPTQVDFFQQTFGTTTNTNSDDTTIGFYKTKVGTDLDAYSKITTATPDLQINDDIFNNLIYYKNISKNDLNGRDTELQLKIAKVNGFGMGHAFDIETITESLISKLSTVAGSPETKYDIYDLSKPIDLLTVMSKKITTYEDALRKQVADELRKQVEDSLGFDPTIRNIVKILAKHIEVFVELIYNVSAKYKSDARLKQLNKFRDTGNLDIHPKQDIFPWPEYRDENNVEQYLGKEGILEKPLDVPEVEFIEKFYAAILVTAAKNAAAESALDSSGPSIWYGVNPLDTLILNPNNISPYKRVPTPALPNDISAVVLIRALTFLAVSNRKLNQVEIESMAQAEAARICDDLNGAVNTNLLAFKSTSTDKIKATKIKTGAGLEERAILTQDSSNWNYSLYKKENGTEYVPIVTGLTKIITATTLNNINFLSNYNANQTLPKPVDGGVYIKIISDTDYTNSNGTVLIPNVSKGSIIDYKAFKSNLEKLTDLSGVGFDPFGSTHGVQEFKSVNWGDVRLNSLDFRYLFYGDNNKKANGLCQTVPLDKIDSSKFKDQIQVLGANLSSKDSRDKFYNDNHPSQGLNKLMVVGADNTTAAYPFINFSVKGGYFTGEFSFSLFGSRFYYEQSIKARAFLFLHSFPWKGLTETSIDNTLIRSGIFGVNEIINSFAYRAGFVQVPKLWPVFIGALLWRKNESLTTAGDPIKFIGTTGTTGYLPIVDENTNYPTADYYLTTNFGDGPLSFTSSSNNLSSNYKTIEQSLFNLPQQVKNEFIASFNDFITNEWDKVRGLLELLPLNGTGVDWVNKFKETNSEVVLPKGLLPTNNLSSRYQNYDNLNAFNFIVLRTEAHVFNNETNAEYNLLLELKEKTPSMEMMIVLFKDTSWIANTQWNIWSLQNTEQEMKSGQGQAAINKDNETTSINLPSVHTSTQHTQFSVSNTDLDLYLKMLLKSVKGIIEGVDGDGGGKKSLTVSENNEVKLNLYRSIKAIYDKWIGGVDSPDEILFQCGDRLAGDTKAAEKRTGVLGTKPTLIDSFRFISRSFKDIGDEFYVNPKQVVDYLIGDNNQSAYSFLSRVLSQNNFDFIALPSFIDFNDPAEVKSIFTPYNYASAAKINSSGPSFICMYVGQVSTKLDFDNANDNYSHPNDGIDMRKDGKIEGGFQEDEDEDSVNERGVAFMVNYGNQNQNIFKDVTLDQTEFSETAESLQIMDDLASQKNNGKVFVGQNLYNVWSVRSYKAQVEMLGDAMIQPMMYFQLNNVPMFHGAYLIITVKHNIKPNHMTTNFTGVRIKQTETPLIEASTMYSSLLSDITATEGTVLSAGVGNNQNVISASGVYGSYITYALLENAGLKIKDGLTTKYSIKENGQLMEKIALAFNKQAIGKGYFETIVVTDASKYGGGAFGGHKEHSDGRAFDIRLITNDPKDNGSTTATSPNFSSGGTLDLCKTIIDIGGVNVVEIYVSNIPFIDAVNAYSVSKGVTPIGRAIDKNNHLHVRFTIPQRVIDDVKNGVAGDFNPTVTDGQAVNYTPLPIGNDIKKYLGKI